MVPRENEGDPRRSPKSAETVSRAMFGQWTRMLALALQPFATIRLRVVCPRISIPEARTIIADGAALLSVGRDSAERSTTALTVFAVVAVSIGAIASVLLSDQEGFQPIVGALIGIGWVMIRLPIMRAVFNSTNPVMTSRLTESWVAGSVPYILAFSPGMRAIAWLIGAILAYRVLSKDGTDPVKVRKTIVIGFGFEALGTLAVIFTRYSMVILERF